MAIPVYATKNVERRFDEIEVIGRVVEKYLVNDGSYIYFDYEKADTNICFHKMLILKYFFK